MNYKTKLINGKAYYVHRLVMELHLNRKLSRRENVHHINGDKTDNRLENLEVIDVAEHARHHSTGRKLSEEAKKKIGDANKIWRTGKKLSQETKEKISLSHKGKNTWSKGKILSKETKEKMSLSHQGKKFTKQHLENIKKAAILREKNKKIKYAQ